MQQLRVVDLAHTMGITPRELIFKLRSIGVTVMTEEDTLDLSTVRSIITGETLQRRPREVIVRREKAEEESTTLTAKDRMVRRRKRLVVDTEKEIQEVAGEKKPERAELEAEAAAEVEVAEVVEEAEAAASAEEVEVEAVAAEAEPAEDLEIKEHLEIEGDLEIEPEVEITEGELTAAREQLEGEEAPQRVRPARAKTPLEQSLRELSPDEIRQRLADQRDAEKTRKAEKATGRVAGGGGSGSGP